MAESLKNLKKTVTFLLHSVYYEFVGQLKKDKSLVLRARDLIYFTTDLQIVFYYSKKALRELIYLLKDCKYLFIY